jgi:predicted molibdopterin-dependent oxidoreductase YjgC
MLSGSIGRPGAGMLPLRGQNNVQGNADMGAMPNQVTGYQSVTDPAVRVHFASVWAEPPPAEPGMTSTEMLEAAYDGRLRGLWIQGEDIAQSDPNQSHVVEALDRLDLLVVQDLFLCETARYADLVLPAAGALEQSGTFINGERRVQLVRPAVPPPGEARPDWWVFVEVARALGCAWSYADPAEVMDEIALAAPHLFGGVRHDRLGGDGLQWPCPSLDHPGTSRVHADGFLRGRGLLVTLDHVPSPERASDVFPYLLITGRVLEHYNVGTMTTRTPNQELTDADRLELHPEDARQENIEDGSHVVISSKWGQTRAQVRITDRVARGTSFLSFHHLETHTNRVVGPHIDAQSKCPQYKLTAVRIHPA